MYAFGTIGNRGLNAATTMLLLALLFAGLPAEGREGPALLRQDQVTRGSLLLRSDTPGLYVPAPLVETDIEVVVAGLGARTVLRQRFRNPSQAWVEGLYAFPLSEKAAVDGLRLRIGDRFIEGRIKPKEEARAIYREARESGRKASLVESRRANLFTTAVANIGPGESVSVEIHLQQPVALSEGRFSLRLPLVAAPRFLPPQPVAGGFDGAGWRPSGSTTPADDLPPAPLRAEADGPGNPVHLRIRLDAGMPLAALESPYHEIVVEDGEGTAKRIRLRRETVPADRDFVLHWQPEPAKAPRAGLFHERVGERDYLNLMLMPPPESFLATGRPERDITFIIDTSGSMGGTSIVQARAALLLALGDLRPDERFNIIAFNSEAQALWSDLRAAEGPAVAEARRWVGGLTAGGGTMMQPALAQALALPPAPDRLQQIVFITDGNVGNESELFSFIADNLGARRLFTVGIGSAPNGLFMRGAARAGRGSFVHIGKPEEVGPRMQTLFGRLKHPVLSDIRLRAVGVDGAAASIAPEPVPDLYAGEPLRVMLRLDRPATALVVEGMTPNGLWRETVPLGGGARGAGLDRLWAKARIEALEHGLLLGADPEATRQDRLDVALEYGLVTDLTSLVAVDVTPSRPREAGLESRAVPLNLPAGWERDSLLGRPASPALPPVRDARAGAAQALAFARLAASAKAAPAAAEATGMAAPTLLPRTATADGIRLLFALALALFAAALGLRFRRTRPGA